MTNLFSGTSSIVDEKTHEPLISILSLICETAVKLHKDGHKVIIVSSGAIGVGLRRMDIEKRPKHLPRIQVCPLGALLYMTPLTKTPRSGSDWPVSTDRHIGHDVWTPATTCGTDTSYKK